MADVVTQRYVPAFPVHGLAPHPDNPRVADTDALAEVLDALGFYGAVLVQEGTGYVLAGWHRVMAAGDLGATTVPALLLDVDDARAVAIMLVDNRASDVASWDDDALAASLMALLDTPGGLAGSGFTEADAAAVIAAAANGEPFVPAVAQPTDALADTRSIVLVYASAADLAALLDALALLGASWDLDTTSDVVAALLLSGD